MVIHPQARTTPRLRAEIKAQHDPNLLWSPSTRPIDWDRLIAKRPTVLATIDDMPAYLLKPEVLALLDEEKVSAPESTPFFRTPSATDFLLSHHNAGECHGPDRQY